MNKDHVITQLQTRHPNKNIVALPPDDPTEIICEVEPTSDHPEYSVAIAVIDHSAPHYHKQTTETYKVLRGSLTLFVDDAVHQLEAGDTFVINPGQIHHVEASEAWVECTSRPGWTTEDHILVS